MLSVINLSATCEPQCPLGTGLRGPEDDDISKEECIAILEELIEKISTASESPGPLIIDPLAKDIEYYVTTFNGSPQMKNTSEIYYHILVHVGIQYILRNSIVDPRKAFRIFTNATYKNMIEQCVFEMHANTPWPELILEADAVPWAVIHDDKLTERTFEFYILTFREFCGYIGIDPDLPDDHPSMIFLKSITNNMMRIYKQIEAQVRPSS